MNTILNMDGIVKTYVMGGEEQVILDNVQLKVEKGEFVSVLGPSGSGKSTLMNIIGCLDTPTKGDYILNGNDVSNLDEITLSEVRNKEIGFVFQQFQLLPRLTALENVELPLIYSGIPEKERKQLAEQMLVKVGLENRIKNKPNQLSGGQQQRVAIARALVTKPTILLADEPTGALDQKTGKQIMELFAQLHSEGKTIIMITHDKEIARHGSRIVNILDGKLTEHVEIIPQETTNVQVVESLINQKEPQNCQSVASKPTATLTNDETFQATEAFGKLLGAFSTFLQDEQNRESTSAMLKQIDKKISSLNTNPQNNKNEAGEINV